MKLLMEWIILFIGPVHINQNEWQKKFTKIIEITQSNTGDEYLIMADFFVREEEGQELPQEANYYTQNAKPISKSKDKIVNSKGKQFFEHCENQ